ncbi:unnamed protein product, partial [Porites evermanni]
RYYRERREKVGNMSSFNSWLIFVTLLFKIFFYQSLFAGYNSSYPPSVLDCNFDDSTFCEWANDNSERSKFNWTLQSGQTPSLRT